ncbi:MAG: ribonuclease D [Alphaproteobacteria bacterium]|nr:ribonuclease D [Pseudomonadota bacterium]MCZ6483728.1 ribonuclease D [Alphaproteobacteria bacterium]MCH7633584.1 ribonuclease D [Pseudomonadota bacterium]MCH8137535.1 ribonuclease D [Pseudomonadota bacterium]MCZ6743961.1 ribonuclease D [Alphaproteobacteria bacterium]
MANHLHRSDLPDGLDLGNLVAVDCETMGLNPLRDRLCLVQISAGEGDCHLVQFPADTAIPYDSPRLKALLTDPDVTKLFHFARFDLAAIHRYLGVACGPVYCTKIASRLARTFTDRHSLKDLCRGLLGIEISKQQQTSDWGAESLTDEQLKYAAADVQHLHALKQKLDEILEREGRAHLAEACCRFLPVRAELDLSGWASDDIFAH